MNNFKKFAGFSALSLLVVAGAFAGPTNKSKLNLPETVTIGDKQLPAGDYKVEWTGTGSNVEVSISNGKEVVAKVPAQILELKKASTGNGYSTSAANGTKTLTDIFVGGKKFELSLGETSASAASASKAQGNN
jgi:hypothetical protein